MSAKIRRSYKGAAVSAVLGASGVTSSTQTSISLTTSPSTWPTGKFFVVVAPGTSQEEKMCVTISGSVMTVVDPTVTSTSASSNGRGVDNTTARSAIAGGATVYPVFTAIDADEANELASTYSAQGHIVYQGASTFAGLAIGTAGQVIKVNAGATAPEWGQVPTAGIADDAVTAAKIATGAVGASEIATGAVGSDELASDSVITAKIADGAITSAKIADGTIVAGDIADGAITSAKILDGTIATGDIANAAITNAKINNGSSGDVALVTVSDAAPANNTIGKNGDIWIVV